MFKVVDKLAVGNKYCVSIEGDTRLLKNELKLIDEIGNLYVIESVGMVKYRNVEDHRWKAELILKGDVANIGKSLRIKQSK